MATARRPISGGVGLAQRACVALAWAVLALAPSATLAQASRPGALDAWAQDRLAEILAGADADENADLGAARQALSGLFDALIAYGDERRVETWVETDEWLRLAAFFEHVPARRRGEVWRLLRANPDFAARLAFTLAEEDEPKEMSTLLLRLAAAHGDKLNEFGSLAAAICVVFEVPLHRDINENRATSPDPVALFGYFLEHEHDLVFSPRAMPPEILIYVVDVTASIDELEWALKEHRGDRRIGETYFDIAYDYDSVLTGADKKVTQMGWNLRNIEKFGGICADQAYYAMTCGKAIGVPTAYVTANNAVVGHAWVGFVEGRGSRAEWNLTCGHYDAYKGVEGDALDAQRRVEISEGELAFLAESITEPREQRWAAAALTDAAERLLVLENNRENYPPPYPLAVETSRQLPRTRPPTLDDALALLETGLKRTPGCRRGWDVLRKVAARGRLSYEQKQDWAQALDRLTGSKYPDFTLSVLRPMIETVEDPEDRIELWERALKICSGRSDLAAEIRMAQGAIWESQHEKAKAWACYQEVIQRYANDGPFAIDALKAAERMLRMSGKTDQIKPLYEDAWKRIRPPEEMAAQFMRQSNYFRVGVRYAQLLDQAGRTNLAAGVRGKIGVKGGN